MMILLAYLAVINFITYMTFGLDKGMAVRGKRRVPEKRLFTLAAAGGAAGAWLGMNSFRHKTKHRSFRLGIPALFVLNMVCCYFIWKIV